MTPIDDLEQKAMRLGALAAIRSEEYAAAHPAEIAERRFFFRRLLEKGRLSSLRGLRSDTDSAQ